MVRACRRFEFFYSGYIYHRMPSAWGLRLSKIDYIYVNVRDIYRLYEELKEQVDIESILAEVISHEFIHGILERDFDYETSSGWDYWGNGSDDLESEKPLKLLTCDITFTIRK